MQRQRRASQQGGGANGSLPVPRIQGQFVEEWPRLGRAEARLPECLKLHAIFAPFEEQGGMVAGGSVAAGGARKAAEPISAQIKFLQKKFKKNLWRNRRVRNHFLEPEVGAMCNRLCAVSRKRAEKIFGFSGGRSQEEMWWNHFLEPFSL